MTLQPEPEDFSVNTEAEAKDFVRSLSDGDANALPRLEKFVGELLSENKRQNLIGQNSEDVIWQRHIADSAQLLRYVPRGTFLNSAKNDKWLDLGTGAGFPGLIVAAICPEWPIVLVESRGRRAEFLSRMVASLSLPNVEVLGERLERVSPFPCAIISARAFAPLNKLLRLSAPFSTAETRYILPKGRSAAQELTGQKQSIRRMFHVKQSITDENAGIIVSR